MSFVTLIPLFLSISLQTSDFYIGLGFSSRDFVVWVQCYIVCFLCGVVWFHFLSRCSFDFPIERSDIQSLIWASMLYIWRHGYSCYFNFIILFVDILSLYAINFDGVSLFIHSSFMFLEMLNDVLYQFERCWMIR